MKNKRKLEELSVDEFLEAGLSGSDTSEGSTSEAKGTTKAKKLKLKEKNKNIKNTNRAKELHKKRNSSSEKADRNNAEKKHAGKVKLNKTKKIDSVAKHKATLQKLKEKDPEFYQFLQEEDQELLKFGEDEDNSEFDDSEAGDDEDDESSVEEEGDQREESDSDELIESTDSDEEVNVRKSEKINETEIDDEELFSEDEEDSQDEEGLHRMSGELEVVTDSEDEDDEVKRPKGHDDDYEQVTIKMVNEWAKGLQERSPAVLKELVQAFRAAVRQAGSDSVGRSKYRVKGSTVFNAIVRTCMTEIPSMLGQFLKLPKKRKAKTPVLPRHSPQWKSVQKSLLIYLTDLIELLSQLAEPDLLNVVLKHVAQMIPYYASNPKLTKAMLRKLISFWSTGEETSRVIAFLSLIKLTRLRQETFLEFVLKQMYMSYIRNCKFTSPSTLQLINFMQRSLVEIFALDQELTYQYAFVYIRQLAIHLRNAITVKKKESYHAVYNWQYIHSLHLWARVLSELYPSEVLQPLIYPLVQTIIGTIKLVPTARYYPLRFHCVRALNILSETTNTYIPTLPFLVEIFDLTDFNKKPRALSFKPFNFACVLKLSKTQLNEKSFTDGVIDQLYEHLMDSFHIHAHTIGFPELALPAILQMKKFVKTCKVPSYTKQIKQIIDKVEETSAVIAKRRQNASVSLSDTKAVELWESKSKEEGTPLGKYYATWRKLRDRELQYELAGKERISSDNLPVIERRSKESKIASDKERKEFSGLFASSSEDDDNSEDDSNRFLLKSERPQKKGKMTSEADSDYSDFDDDELEKLAQSGSEEETGDDEDINDGDDDDGDDDDDDETADEEDKRKAKITSDLDDSSDEDDIVEDFHLSSDED